MKKNVFLALLALAGSAHAYEGRAKKGELAPTLEAMVAKASLETKLEFSPADFILIEERALATSNYKFYVQATAGVPEAKTALRIWSDLKTNELILGELHLNTESKKNKAQLVSKYLKAKFSPAALKSNQLSVAIEEMVSKEVSTHATDSRILGIKSKDMWLDGELVREVQVRGRRGIHTVKISLLKNKILDKSYQEFPQSENVYGLVYPIYEEVESTGELLKYEKRELKYLDQHVHVGGNNPFASFNPGNYPESNYSSILAGSPQGAREGKWSESSLRLDVENLVSKLPTRANNFQNGVLLTGK